MSRNATAIAAHDPQVDEEASVIFGEAVTFNVKPSGRDEFTAALTLRLRPDNISHPRSLLFEITDDNDLLFYHSLVLGEADFHTLKSEQRLLVDFQSFPAQLVELLRRCVEANGQPSTNLPCAGDGPRMLARLECSASGESILSIVESNQFRELIHISLKLRQGTDESVKRHLAGKLRSCRSDKADLAQRLHTCEEALGQSRRQVDEFAARVRVIGEERTHLERSLESTHQRELTELKTEHSRAVAEIQRAANEEKLRIEEDLRKSLQQALARATKAETGNEELQQQCQMLMTSGKGCQDRLDASETEISGHRKDIQQLRELSKQLETLKFQHEREIVELTVQVSSLKEQMAAKDQLLSNQATQLEQASSQRKNLEDMLATCKQQVHTLEDKFALSAQEIAKGNQIIQNLHASAKQAKAKLRLKANALAETEKTVMELEKAEELRKHTLEEKANELSRGKAREERLQQDAEELKKKLAEAHDVLRSNHDVIEYLNRQLTERDLKGVTSLQTTSVSEPTRTPLAELLARATKASQGLKAPSSGTDTASSGFGIGSLNYTSRNLTVGAGLTGMSCSGVSGASPGFIPSGFGALGLGISGRTSTSAATPSLSAGLKDFASQMTGPAYSLVAGRVDSMPGFATASSDAQDPLRGPVVYRSPAMPAQAIAAGVGG